MRTEFPMRIYGTVTHTDLIVFPRYSSGNPSLFTYSRQNRYAEFEFRVCFLIRFVDVKFLS